MSTRALKKTMKKAPKRVTPISGGRSRISIDFGGVLADALQAVEGFGEDRAAADQGAEVEAEERHDRDQRVAQDVAGAHLALGQALGLRRAHVVLVHRVEHVRAQHAAVEADVEDRQGDPGEDQVGRPFERFFGQPDVFVRREYFDLERQVDEEEPGQPEDGHRDPDQRPGSSAADRSAPRPAPPRGSRRAARRTSRSPPRRCRARAWPGCRRRFRSSTLVWVW